jgi:predicted RNase H-like HicB family nuclease
MNLPVSQPQSLDPLSWQILLESQADGQVAAWVAEWPECRVVAESREMAIAMIRNLMDVKSQTIEVEPLTIPISGPIGENPWQLIYGALRNDPEFIAWAEAFWVGKKRNKDNDEILSVEECMQVM